MSKERVKALQQHATENERVKLQVLYNAQVRTLQEYNDDSTSPKLRDMNAAEDAFNELLDRLEAKYLHGDDAALAIPPEPTWDTYTDTKVQKHVLEYLQRTGWDIKKSTFSTHCRTGKLTKNRQGVYNRAAVKKYAEKYLVHLGLGVTVDENAENLATKKTIAEISRIKVAEERDRFKLEVEQGKYIARELVEKELASRAVVLDQGLEFFFRAKVDEMIALVGGKVDKAPQLLEMCLIAKDEQMNTYSRMDNFIVIVEGE